MTISYSEKIHGVVVQGLGPRGREACQVMYEAGTEIVAGVNPGKGGQKIKLHRYGQVKELDIYDTVKEALKDYSANASVGFVPRDSAVRAAFEALDNGLKTLVIITEGIPVDDIIQVMGYAKLHDATVIGPNTPGIISPGIGPGYHKSLGVTPYRCCKEGKIGLVSRSGTMSYLIESILTEADLGESTCIGLGGDPVVGLSFVDALREFEKDEQTKGVVLIGEIGGDLEELAAEFIVTEGYENPVVAFLVGQAAPRDLDVEMGHAGTVSSGIDFGKRKYEIGTFESKLFAFKEEARVPVVDDPRKIPYVFRSRYGISP